MRVVPELVFVNCCHLAARNTAQLLTGDGSDGAAPPDRPRSAAGVAEELIKIGVRCVIAAGWAVEDDAAKAFATSFYDALLGGRRFIDAVAEAREVAWALGGNTWAAYQCYGDPDWCFVRDAPDAQRPRTSFVDEFAGVASSKSLVLALESLAVKSKFQKAPAAEQQGKIRYLEARFARSGKSAKSPKALDAHGTKPATAQQRSSVHARARRERRHRVAQGRRAARQSAGPAGLGKAGAGGARIRSSRSAAVRGRRRQDSAGSKTRQGRNDPS
jgi:hypothetical protein